MRFFRQAGLMEPVFEFSRISGVSHSIPLVGCAKAHINALERGLGQESPLAIFEDDAELVASISRLKITVRAFLEDSRLDVLVLSPSLYGVTLPISSVLAISCRVRTTAAYIVKPSAIPHLISRFSISCGDLLSGKSERRHALDVAWQKDQKHNLLFAVPRERLIQQSPSFSDIQRREVDYR